MRIRLQLENVPENLSVRLATLATHIERIHERKCLHEKQKGGENEIGGTPTVPLRMHNRPIRMFIAAGIIDDDHARDH